MSPFSFVGGKGSDNVPAAVRSMTQRGQDPKEMLIEVCKVIALYYIKMNSHRAPIGTKDCRNANPYWRRSRP